MGDCEEWSEDRRLEVVKAWMDAICSSEPWSEDLGGNWETVLALFTASHMLGSVDGGNHCKWLHSRSPES